MALYTFGTGALFAVRGDVANSTPVKFGALQEASVEFTATSKELYGQYQFPLAVARGKGKISGKAKFGQIQGRAFFDLFFGQAASAGQTTLANAEAQSVPTGGGPYTVQVTNHASFIGDLGVVYAGTGLPLVQVAASPLTGQYAVAPSTGTYTFASGDAGAAILVSYQYTVSGSGQQFTLAKRRPPQDEAIGVSKGEEQSSSAPPMPDVSVSFGADADELLESLKEIDADLKQIAAAMGAIVQSSAQAGTALSQMASSGTAAMKGLADAQKQQKQAADAATAQWKQALAPIDRAFTESISGIIRGTQTAQQAIARFGQSMVASFIDDAEKSVTNWIASELAKTTATQAGVAARNAAEDKGQSVGLIKLIELTLRAIGIDSEKVFADVFAFFAPDMGPAAAGPAAASAASVRMAGGAVSAMSADVGIWDVPRDMLAFIHRGETVLPADFATGFRNAAGGGRGGGPMSTQISISALDGASVKRVLGDNHGAVASALRRAWRHGAGSRR